MDNIVSPASRRLQYGIASNVKLGEGLGTRLILSTVDYTIEHVS